MRPSCPLRRKTEYRLRGRRSPVDGHGGLSRRIAAQRARVSLDPQPFFITDGMVEVKALETGPRDQKVLWQSENPHSLAPKFVHHAAA